jgi:hypothetical protein
MKYIKLFEARQTEAEIAEICELYDIKNWSINSEGLVDVNGYVNLFNKKLTNLPLNFGHISGDFDCANNYLTNLKGCPKSVGGFFDCHSNELTSLEGSPKVVSGSIFYCSNNQLTSLRFAPEEIEGMVNVLPNPISDIPEKYLNKEYLGFIVKEQYDWNLYRKDGTIYLERLEQMIEWGIETNKIEPI